MKKSLFSSICSFLLPCVYFFALSSVSLFGQCDCDTPPAGCALQPPLPPPGCLTPSGNSYILRFSVSGVRGAMTFIGNTLGLSKAECLNLPGTNDSIGAFTTTNNLVAVPGWPTIAPNAVGGPAGTTLLWQQNSSSALLTIPPGATVLRAELFWSGSYGYFCDNPDSGPARGVDVNCVLDFADGPIFLTAPNGTVFPVTADIGLESQNQADDVQLLYCGGNYVRSADITSFFTLPALANPNGLYTVSGVPATVSPFDETHNSAGWTLAIIYRDNSNPNVNNMSLFISNQQAQRPPPDDQFPPAEVSGFCAAPSLTIGQGARLLVSAIEADANKTGDSMRFGPSLPLTALDNLIGPNNLENNFFACQINGDNGQLITTSGTYCPPQFQQNPVAGTNVSGGRQGYDITNIDISTRVSPGQTTAFAQGTTDGDDYMINALGIQISVTAPVIVPTKRVNGQLSVVSNVGETVHFSLEINNNGNGGASNVIFQDILEPGLQLVPNTFRVDNVLVPNPNLVTGVSLGSIAVGQIVTIDFDVFIASRPVSGNIFHNFGTTPFEFNACDQEEPFQASNDSNVVTILLPEIAPTDFVGKVKKCPFLNKNEFSLRATFTPIAAPNVYLYQVLKDGLVVATIPANGPFEFEACLDSKKDAELFSLEAVFTNNVKSTPINIRIVK